MQFSIICGEGRRERGGGRGEEGEGRRGLGWVGKERGVRGEWVGTEEMLSWKMLAIITFTCSNETC